MDLLRKNSTILIDSHDSPSSRLCYKKEARKNRQPLNDHILHLLRDSDKNVAIRLIGYLIMVWSSTEIPLSDNATIYSYCNAPLE